MNNENRMQQKEKDIHTEEAAWAKGQRNDSICIIHFIIREDVNMEGEGERWSCGQRQQALK